MGIRFTNTRVLRQLLFGIVGTLALWGQSFGQTSQNLNLLFNWDDDNLPVSGSTAYNDIWGYAAGGREYAIVGTIEGFRIFDVTNPSTGVQVAAEIGASTNSLWRDMKTYQNYLYVVSDQGAASSLQIYDLSGLPSSITKVHDSQTFFSTCHNIFIDQGSGRLYAAGTTTSPSGVVILDIATDPVNPALLANFALGAYVHDCYSHNDTLVAFFGFNGIGIFDFANLAAPGMISYVGTYTEPGYAHSGWADAEFNTLYWAAETNDTGIKISDFTSGGYTGDVDGVFRSTLQGPTHTNSVPHNQLVKGDYLYISYYHDGVQIYDISDRTNPTRAAFYDTYPQNTDYSGGFSGCWGVYPFLPSGRIIATDTENGLFVFEMSNVTFPVELTDFRAEDQGDRIRLAWTTTQEVNNDFFDIEKSIDGVNFEVIDRIDGHGTTDMVHDYEAYDLNPFDGRAYYRLHQVDRDGGESYSEIVTVNRARTLQFYGIAPSPAPSGQTVRLGFDMLEQQDLEIQVVDVVGRVMYHQIHEMPSGLQSIEIPTQGWSAGTYLAKIGAGSEKFSRKFILTR